MCNAAGDLRRFVVAQIIGKQTAFRFDYEVKALLPVDLDEDRPVGIVASQRGRHFKPTRKLGVDLHRLFFSSCSAKVRSTPAESYTTCSNTDLVVSFRMFLK